MHNFFCSKFHELWPNLPKFINGLFKKLSSNESLLLESNFIVDEIKVPIFYYGSEKEPGPDKFIFMPLKGKWETIKDDVIRYVKYFEKT